MAFRPCLTTGLALSVMFTSNKGCTPAHEMRQGFLIILTICDNGYYFQAQTFTICTNENIIMPLKHPGA